MKIAVTYENGQVFQHFGHTAQFKLYDVEQGAVVTEKLTQRILRGWTILLVKLNHKAIQIWSQPSR